MRRALRESVEADGLILAGPWRGDVIVEVGTWIPLLRWAAARHRLDPARVVAVSRGGVADWYAGIAERYIEIFDLASVDELGELASGAYGKKKDRAPVGRKPTASDPVNRILSERVAETVGRPLTAIDPFWAFRASSLVEAGLSRPPLHFGPIVRAAPLPATLELPDAFVAVRFYSNPTFGRNEATGELVGTLLSALSEAGIPMFSLETGLMLDGHKIFDDPIYSSLPSLSGHVGPANNLAAQTAVLQRASGYVGTFGGTAFLSAWAGTPTTALYRNPERVYPQHIALARSLARASESSHVPVRLEESVIESIVGDTRIALERGPRVRRG
jgi:hypothetical protein